MKCKEEFTACMDIKVGKGARVSSQEDNWRTNGSLKAKFLNLFKLSTQNMRYVQEALREENGNIACNLNDWEIMEYAKLMGAFPNNNLNMYHPHRMKWNIESSGIFSMTSPMTRLKRSEDRGNYYFPTSVWKSLVAKKVQIVC